MTAKVFPTGYNDLVSTLSPAGFVLVDDGTNTGFITPNELLALFGISQVASTPSLATVPTADDSSAKLASTSFVGRQISGVTQIYCAGGAATLAMTAAQAGSGILVFYGVLTANLTVTVPTTSRNWIVSNITTGAYVLTFKTTTGTGVVLAQGANRGVFSDGTNIAFSNTSSASSAIYFAGTWNASTNIPAFANGTGVNGAIYTVSAAGSTSLDGITQWNVGDAAVFDGSSNVWRKINGLAQEVVSVGGSTGVVTVAQLVTAGLAPTANPSFTGAVAVPTPATSDNSANASNTSWVRTYVASLGFATSSAAEQVSNKGAANGYAPLDSSSRVPYANLPATLQEAIYFAGTWNASTNTPAFVSGSGTPGAMFKISVSGTTLLDGTTQWNVGDQAIFNGVSNTWVKIDGVPSEVLSVAGRTGAVTLVVADVLGSAPSASPVFTGTPSAPTPAASDSSTTIPTTAFVQNAIGGLSTVSVAGGANTALTSAQASVGILNLTGAITANITVSVPSGASRSWIVSNNTTGAFTVTLITAGGSGQVLPQGKNTELYSDGTNVNLSTSAVTYSVLPAQVQTLPLAFMFVGKPSAGQVANMCFAQTTTLPANFAGTVQYSSTITTANAAFAVNKYSVASGTSAALGTITLTTSNHGSITLSTQAAVTFLAGDVLQLIAPATQDATLADLCITVLAMKV